MRAVATLLLGSPLFQAMDILTHKTTLVPASEFLPEKADLYLRMAGLAPLHDECALWSAPCCEKVAVMAVGRALMGRYEGKELWSPLLTPHSPLKPTIWLYSAQHLLYIKVYDNELRLAEVVRAENEADVHYYLSSLKRALPAAEYELLIEGSGAKGLRAITKYYW